jgi:hypothetical protein
MTGSAVFVNCMEVRWLVGKRQVSISRMTCVVRYLRTPRSYMRQRLQPDRLCVLTLVYCRAENWSCLDDDASHRSSHFSRCLHQRNVRTISRSRGTRNAADPVIIQNLRQHLAPTTTGEATLRREASLPPVRSCAMSRDRAKRAVAVSD